MTKRLNPQRRAKTKAERERARLVGSINAEMKRATMNTEFTKSRHGSGKANGPSVIAPRTEGLGEELTCDRCKKTTVTSAKRRGIPCRMTRGCKGHLR